MNGRHCAWCGKPGGTCISILRTALDLACVHLRNDSPYFHPDCAHEAKHRLTATVDLSPEVSDVLPPNGPTP